MILTRRAALSVALPALALGVSAGGRGARAVVPANVSADTLPVHGYGDPKAKVVVQEWFSLTCTHCARFSQTVFPEIKQKLIDTGKIRYVFKDYPLDQVALAAAMAADALPDERYLPFIEALLSSQDRWAFDQNNDPVKQLGQYAALAGLSRDAFTATMNDAKLRQAILDEQDRGQKQYKIEATPSFVFGSTVLSGEMDYETFAKHVAEAGG
ncbi:MAG: thioredoxin domain-containing protein [Gluconacetobacter diazotrophicus]|nr:thioredoxin domain-containing protein [Gluconacetobacter diazotrophicus]